MNFNKQAEFDKCLAQSCFYKFECPSKCLAHNLLRRLLKKLGEHHILALLVEPKILEAPDARLEKIIKIQNEHKEKALQVMKRPLGVVSYSVKPGSSKKPRKDKFAVPRIIPKPIQPKLVMNATISSILSRNSSFTFSNFPSNNILSLMPPPLKSLTSSAQPVIDNSVSTHTEICNLKLKTRNSISYFERAGSSKGFPLMQSMKYVSTQTETKISKIEFTLQKNPKFKFLNCKIFKVDDGPMFGYFGLAVKYRNHQMWTFTKGIKMPNMKVVTTSMALYNSKPEIDMFTIWFGRTSNHELLCSPILCEMEDETEKIYIATFEPEVIQLEDD